MKIIDPVVSQWLPPLRREHPTDPLIGLGFAPLIIALALTTPCTPPWKLVRAAFFTPVIIAVYANWGYLVLKDDYFLQWSIAAGCTYSIIRTLELLLFYPAEENVYRLVPSPGKDGEGNTPALFPEALPAPWTWKKFCWGYSCYQNNRGIGWNYTCNLPSSSRHAPFSRTSTRWHFFVNRTIHFIYTYLITDLARSWMNLGPYRAFFDGRPGLHPGYYSMLWWEKAINSVVIAIRIRWSIENVYYPASIACIGLGGFMGWKGEYWEPWGWPPMFGRIDELWANPGFSVLWSSFYRRWLYVFGWLGIGETILGLPHSGLSARPLPVQVNPKSTTNGAPNGTSSNGNGKLTPPSAAVSGRASPTHPLPTTPAAGVTPTRRTSPGMVLANFIKSCIVFFLCGLIHDHSCYQLLRLHYHNKGQRFKWTDAIVTLPFFVVQPLALAGEAIVKNVYRRWKRSVWAEGKAPKALQTLERGVSFVVVWWWIGWTAHWFVIGLTQVGMFRRDETQALAPSLMGGLIWGKWMH